MSLRLFEEQRHYDIMAVLVLEEICYARRRGHRHFLSFFSICAGLPPWVHYLTLHTLAKRLRISKNHIRWTFTSQSNLQKAPRSHLCYCFLYYRYNKSFLTSCRSRDTSEKSRYIKVWALKLLMIRRKFFPSAFTYLCKNSQFSVQITASSSFLVTWTASINFDHWI